MRPVMSILVAAGPVAGLLMLSCGGDKTGKQGGAPAEQVGTEQVGTDPVTAYVSIREMGYAGLEPVPMKRGVLMTAPPIETGIRKFAIVD